MLLTTPAGAGTMGGTDTAVDGRGIGVATTDVSATTRVSVMRGFELRLGDSLVALPSYVQKLIAYLAVRDRPQLRSTVASSLWIDTTNERASANLRTALWKTRQTVGECVVANGNYVSLSPLVDVDLTRLLRQARRVMGTSTLDERDTDLTDLLGDLLPDWDEEWIVFERERVRQLCIHALESLSRKLSASGRAGEAIDAGLSAVAAEPLRESAQRVLIAAHLEEGNVSEARRQYHAYRELLWDSLGIEPSRTLRNLVGITMSDD